MSVAWNSTLRRNPGKPLRGDPGKQLRRKGWIGRSGKRPVSGWQRQSRPETGFPRRVKLAVRKRAGNGDIDQALCEACGCWLGRYGGEIQHRAARGSGGCADAVINGPANAALLCGSGALRTGCHGACEDRDPHLGMDAAGFWIRHGTTPEFDPRRVAIMLHGADGGLMVWLDEEGGYSYQQPAVAA